MSLHDALLAKAFGGGSGGGADIDVTAEVGQTIIVKEVDENGKPTKWESADYQPRTHWQGEKVMIPEQTFEAGVIGKNIVIHGGDHLIGLTIGKTYKVVFDGVTYTCVAETGVVSMDGVNMINIISIGNLGMFGGVDNGLPFILGDLPDYAPPSWVCLPYVYGEHTLSVTGVDETNTIPEKFVNYYPAFPYYVEVYQTRTSTAGQESDYSCSETWENLEAVYNSGRPIALRLEQYDTDNLVTEYGYYHLSVVWKQPSVTPRIRFIFVLPSYAYGNQPFLTLVPNEDGTYTVQDEL